MRSTDPDDDTKPVPFKDNAAYVQAVHDRGLAFDLATVNRRRVLALFGSSLFALAGCAADSDEPGGTASSPTATPSVTSTPTARANVESTTIDVDEVPDETAGPFPADGSNGPDVLTESGIVRSDITASFGSSDTVAEGVATTIRLRIADADSDQPLAGAAVYLWHCDREGRYSLYSSGAEEENYLRGVQETDSSGTATFETIFPACYSGRWPHIHFEVFESLTAATSGSGQIVKTSQIAFPVEACETVFASAGYGQSVQNLSQTSLESDNVFGDDDGADQLATVVGDLTGMTVSLTVGV